MTELPIPPGLPEAGCISWKTPQTQVPSPKDVEVGVHAGRGLGTPGQGYPREGPVHHIVSGKRGHNGHCDVFGRRDRLEGEGVGGLLQTPQVPGV